MVRGSAGACQHPAAAAAAAIARAERTKNIWQFMRQNWLSNRVFHFIDDIFGHCCDAWNTLIEQTLEDHVARRTCMGSHRSANLTIGIKDLGISAVGHRRR